MKHKLLTSAFLILALAVAFAQANNWVKIFDGKTMTGWKVMAVHGGNGGLWEVQGGALVGNQEKDHKGGLIGTDKKYGDFEIELEFKVDNPADTGLFLRTREDGMGYQITIDYHKTGYIGSLYAPAEGGFIQVNKLWQQYFKKDKWNTMRARVSKANRRTCKRG